MKLRLLVAAMLTAGLVLGSTAASAKGAQQITVTGPGLAAPIRLANSPEAVTSLNRIAEKAGLFEHPADRDLPGRPSGDLGPPYVATYDWLIAQATTTPLRQDLYPFADGGAVAYTPPGQRVGRGGRPPGGWYRGGAELTKLLVAAGVPIPPSFKAPVPVVAPPVVTG